MRLDRRGGWLAIKSLLFTFYSIFWGENLRRDICWRETGHLSPDLGWPMVSQNTHAGIQFQKGGEIMGKIRHVQIFLDDGLFRELAKIARKKGTGISEIIPTAVNEWLTGCQEQDMLNKRLEDLQVIENHRQEILAWRGGKPLDFDAAEVIERMRTERTNELTSSVFPNEGDLSKERND